MELRKENNRMTLFFDGSFSFKPLSLDFAKGRYKWRGERFQHEKLIKALGFPCRNLSVLDGTAGFLVDSWIMANAGCQVTAVEKNAMVFALADDALKRARKDTTLREVAGRIHLVCADVREFQRSASGHDVFYVDPMFEDSGENLSGKEMQILQKLLVPTADFAPILQEARGLYNRILVKRSRKQPPLIGGPKGQMLSKQIRFDIY